MLFVMTMTLGTAASAQGILDRLERRAKQKTEDRALEKADDKMEGALDKIFGNGTKKRSEETDEVPDSQTFEESESGTENAGDEAAAMAAMEKYGMMSDVELDETYRFDHEVKMKMLSYKKGKLESESEMMFMFPEDGGAMGMVMANGESQEGEATTIVDYDDEQMVSLIHQGGMKIGVQYKMSADDWADIAQNYEGAGGENGSSGSAPNIRKTGNSKKILGYECQEYIATDEDGAYTEIWATDDLDFANFFTAMSKMQQKGNYPKDFPMGFMMEMTSWPDGKNGKERMEMRVTEVNKGKENTISTEGYKFMSMGGGR